MVKQKRSFNLLINVTCTKRFESKCCIQWYQYTLFQVPSTQRYNFNFMSRLLINASHTQRFGCESVGSYSNKGCTNIVVYVEKEFTLFSGKCNLLKNSYTFKNSTYRTTKMYKFPEQSIKFTSFPIFRKYKR